MFNKSRRKIILSIMGSLIILFSVTLAVITLASFRDIRHKNLNTLEHFAESYTIEDKSKTSQKPTTSDGEKPNKDQSSSNEQGINNRQEASNRGMDNSHQPGHRDESRPDRGGDQEPAYQLSTFYTVVLTDKGDLVSVDNGDKEIYSEDKLVKLAKKALSEDIRHGRSDNLTYTISKKGDYKLVAFMDNTVSEAGLKTMLRYVVIVGLAAMVFMFFISLTLSRNIIRPLEENDKRQKRFISDASHELKTPLAVISANSEMLSREIGPNEWLANIQYENNRMAGLVKQLLDLSHAESAVIAMEDLDLSRILMGEVLAFEIVAFEAGKEIIANIGDDIRLRANKSQLTQVISILLDNALKHSTGSKIEVTLSQSNNMVLLDVVNEAKEISQEKLDHLFDRFYRIDEARNSQGNHYGIGLSIAKAVIEGHRGHIEASYKNGKICFRVDLPKKNKKN